LGATCKYFRQMFSSGMKESKEYYVEVQDIPYDDFCDAMKFVYCCQFKDPKKEIHDAPSLLNVANYYGLDVLQQIFEYVVCIDPEYIASFASDVWNWLQYAATLNSKHLLQVCVHHLNRMYLDPSFVAQQKLEPPLYQKIQSQLKSHIMGGIVLKRLAYSNYKLPKELSIILVAKSRFCGSTSLHSVIGALQDSSANEFKKSFVTKQGESINLKIYDDPEIVSSYGTRQHLQKDLFTKVDGFMFVFTVIDLASLQSLQQSYDTIKQLRGQNALPFPLVLVGNKIDLYTNAPVTVVRPTPISAGLGTASKWECPYIETSATLGWSVEEAFILLIREIGHKHQAGITTSKKADREKSSSAREDSAKSTGSIKSPKSQEKSEGSRKRSKLEPTENQSKGDAKEDSDRETSDKEKSSKVTAGKEKDDKETSDKEKPAQETLGNEKLDKDKEKTDKDIEKSENEKLAQAKSENGKKTSFFQKKSRQKK